MTEYIERERALEALAILGRQHFSLDIDFLPYLKALKESDRLIRAIPSAEVRENKKAHWIKTINPAYSPFDGSPEYSQVCSECGRAEAWIKNFCGHCGADMRGGDGNG